VGGQRPSDSPIRTTSEPFNSTDRRPTGWLPPRAHRPGDAAWLLQALGFGSCSPTALEQEPP
jgi:hypothetical protein